MLKGISPLLSPQLLATLCEMGHGDEIVLADAHFPGESVGRRVLRADGLRIPVLLDGFLRLMAVVGDTLDPPVEETYRAVIDRHAPDAPAISRLERFAFYDRAREAFAVVMTGETAKYGNVILTKGVTPC